ncbi:MAG: hypothetical protein AB1768_17715 [Pseudomonadota bacterium]
MADAIEAYELGDRKVVQAGYKAVTILGIAVAAAFAVYDLYPYFEATTLSEDVLARAEAATKHDVERHLACTKGRDEATGRLAETARECLVSAAQEVKTGMGAFVLVSAAAAWNADRQDSRIPHGEMRPAIERGFEELYGGEFSRAYERLLEARLRSVIASAFHFPPRVGDPMQTAESLRMAELRLAAPEVAGIQAERDLRLARGRASSAGGERKR